MQVSKIHSSHENIPIANNIPVYLRIKGDVKISSQFIINNDTIICSVLEGSPEQTDQKYKYTKIFKVECTQKKIFDLTVKKGISRFLNAKNSTLLVYGSSGSGKSFTLFGTQEQPGIIPRTIDSLFRSLPLLKKQPQVKPLPNGLVEILHNNKKIIESQRISSMLKLLRSREDHIKHFRAMQKTLSNDPMTFVKNMRPVINIYISFCEIYNEDIFDLLQPVLGKGHSRPKLIIKGVRNRTYISDLTSIHVTSGLEAYELLEYGLQNRKDASKAIHFESSKSHCLFTIKLVQGQSCDNIIVSSFTFCHLEGPERLDNPFDAANRLKEITYIKRSLSILGRCITMVRDGQNKKEDIIPLLKKSKLTHLFQKALLGKEHIQLMVNINPSVGMLSPTLYALNFSAIAKEVVPRTPNHLSGCNRYLDSRDDSEASKDEKIRLLKSECEAFNLNINKNINENKKLKQEIVNLNLQLSKRKCKRQQHINREKKHIIDSYGEIISIKDQQIVTLEMRNKAISEEIEKLRQQIQNNNQPNHPSDTSIYYSTCFDLFNNSEYDGNYDSVIIISDEEIMNKNSDVDNDPVINNKSGPHNDDANSGSYGSIYDSAIMVSEDEIINENTDKGNA